MLASDRSVSSVKQNGLGVMEADLLVRMNRERVRRGKRKLLVDARLAVAARGHSQWMAKHGRFQHQGIGGRTFQTRLDKVGYPRCYSAENLALTNTAEEAVAMWMKSSGHRKNMLNGKYSRVGIGVVGRYWTVNYAEAMPAMSADGVPGLAPPTSGALFQNR
ncbi:MAG: CAP domain-containing protein [Akkermansiaceae bacterium]